MSKFNYVDMCDFLNNTVLDFLNGNEKEEAMKVVSEFKKNLFDNINTDYLNRLEALLENLRSTMEYEEMNDLSHYQDEKDYEKYHNEIANEYATYFIKIDDLQETVNTLRNTLNNTVKHVKVDPNESDREEDLNQLHNF